jgi:hypothetical protein
MKGSEPLEKVEVLTKSLNKLPAGTSADKK